MRCYAWSSLLWFGSLVVQADEVAVPDWMPWAEENRQGEQKGFFVDLLTEVLAPQLPSMELKLLPGSRLARGFALQEWQWGVNFCDLPLPHYLKVAGLVDFVQLLMVFDQSPFHDEDQVRNIDVSRVRLALSMPLSVEKNTGVSVLPVDTISDALRVLQAKRVDGAILSDRAVAWFARKQPELVSGLRGIELRDSRREACLFASERMEPQQRQLISEHLSRSATRERMAQITTRYFGRP